MKIVTVIPLAKGIFRENLTYFSSKDVKNGSIVSISIRNKKMLGLVVSSLDISGIKGDIKDLQFNLKKIIDVKEDSIWREEYFDSMFDINKYFIGRINDTITSLIPSFFRENYDKILKIKDLEIKFNTSNSTAKKIKTEKLLLQVPLLDRVSFYKTMIRGCFAEKKSVFIVLPTEFDIENFKETLSKGIENFTFIIHSGLTNKKTLESLKKIITEPHPVLILGTAPFLSIPRKDIGVIVVEHENSNTYKMIGKPYIDLRLFAEIFASKINAKFILADTLLRFETIERKEKDSLGEVYPLSFRLNSMSKIEILGRGEKFKVLLEESIEKIKNTVKNKQNVFIFSLRKGLATHTVCRNCNTTLNCEECLSPVVLYLSKDGKKRMLVCNKCKRELSPETLCRNCGSWDLMPLGIGTDTVYEEIKKIFPAKNKIKIFKLDKESVKNAKEAREIIKEFSAKNESASNKEETGKILVGTEMAFFYLKEKIPLSIIASFDSLWSIPSFKMGEKIIQIILSIISKTSKEIIIQTKNEGDPALRAINDKNLLPFVREELEDRKNLDYPPFKRFIKITFLGNKDESKKVKQNLEKMFSGYSHEIFSSFVLKNKGKYAVNMLIKIDTIKWSLDSMTINGTIDQGLFDKLASLSPVFSINVDPEDLL